MHDNDQSTSVCDKRSGEEAIDTDRSDPVHDSGKLPSQPVKSHRCIIQSATHRNVAESRAVERTCSSKQAR